MSDIRARVVEMVARVQNAAWNGYEEDMRVSAEVIEQLVALIESPTTISPFE